MNPIKRRTKSPEQVASKKSTSKTAVKVAPKKPVIKRQVKAIALKPKISEKTYAVAEQHNTYVFEVPTSVNKHDIGYAIAAQYEVGVVKVRVASVPGKAVRSYRRKGRNVYKGSRSDIRKAYVTLNEGDKLPIFSAVEEAGDPAKDQKGSK